MSQTLFFKLSEISCFDSGVPLLPKSWLYSVNGLGPLQLYYGPRAANLEDSVVRGGKEKVSMIFPEHDLKQVKEFILKGPKYAIGT